MATFLSDLATGILKCGQIPKHIGFIMDGNRRFAKRTKINDGHEQGFETLGKVLTWCHDLGVRQVSLYAFSIENFKRSPEEVGKIMRLFCDKLDQLMDEVDRITDLGLKVRFAGDLTLLPMALRDRIDKMILMTENNNKATLNICLAYTARHEITNCLRNLATIVKAGRLRPEEINLSSLEKELFIPRPFPDIIIRTSGEVRLSDFMLWQCQKSLLVFVDALWPELSIWDFHKAILLFQCANKFNPVYRNL